MSEFELSSQHHSFDIKLCGNYGMEEAVLIHHFLHWIRINRAAGRNVRDGRCWTYQTRKEIQLHFPYWNVDKVKYLCEKLVKSGVMICTGKYNKSAIDKTLWYAFANEKAFGVDEESSNNVYERQKCPSMGKSASSMGKSAPPIPDTKPDTETKEKEEKNKQKDAGSSEADLLCDFIFSKIKEKKPNLSGGKSPTQSKATAKLLKIRKRCEIEKIVQFALENDFWDAVCTSPAKILKHLDTLEIQMGRANDSPASKIQSDRDLAKKIEKMYPNESDIKFGESYIEFDCGPSNRPHLKFGDKGFREQVIHFLRKIKLETEGL